MTNRTPPTPLKLLTFHVLTAVQHANDEHGIIGHPQIDTAVPVRENSQARTNPISRRAGKTGRGDPLYLLCKVFNELERSGRIFFSDIGMYPAQIIERGL
jgi:hypothetical protein